MTVVRSEVGPTGTLAEMHREHYRSLVKLASLLIDDRATCEEVVQDAFVAVFRSGARLRDEAKLPAYLRSAVLNGARSPLTSGGPSSTQCGHSPIANATCWCSASTSTFRSRRSR